MLSGFSRPSVCGLAVLVLTGLVGCHGKPTTGVTLTSTDTDTSEPDIFTSFSGTGVFIPQDTSSTGPPNLDPAHWVYMSQLGTWNLGSSSPPYNDLSGTMAIKEYVDTLDTALPEYECNVTYSLTGQEVTNSTCPAGTCDFVFDVEYYVTSGDPAGCHDPDAPTSGQVLELGMDQDNGEILINYYGTDVWLDWYDANKSGSTVNFSWTGTLAIELTDTATQ